jgi:hypothetical protein
MPQKRGMNGAPGALWEGHPVPGSLKGGSVGEQEDAVPGYRMHEAGHPAKEQADAD